jgi:hypothetical protein
MIIKQRRNLIMRLRANDKPIELLYILLAQRMFNNSLPLGHLLNKEVAHWLHNNVCYFASLA